MRTVFRIGTLAALILTVAFHGSFGRGEIIDRIVAIVNDEIITFSELEEFRKSFYRQAPEKNDWLEHEFDLLDLRLQVLNTLIDERLIDQEADRQRISVTQKQLDDTIESLRKEQGLSENQLEMTLKARGMTFEAYREQVEKGLKRTRLINRTVKTKIEVTEENLRAYYETHSQNYLSEESVRISHISLPVPQNPTDDPDESVLLIVKDIMRRAVKGEDFASLALQYAQDIPGIKGGDLGYFKKGELIPAIDEKAFTLRKGEVGEPIRTRDAIILVKVTDRKDEGPIPFDEIREALGKDYRKTQAEQLYQQWIRDLRERSFIEVKL